LTEETIEGWLTDSYDYERPRRGQVREGVILRVEKRGVMVDIGLKREGIVPHRDIERLGNDASTQLNPGQEVATYIVKPEDREGNLVLSLFKARIEQDWAKAKEMLESGEIWQGKVTGCNKGGLSVKFGRLDGFVPGSHLWARDRRRVSSDYREEAFREYVGQELPLKVIEVHKGKHRLVLSERRARRQLREQQLQHLLSELQEGQTVQGTVSHLCDFGAFVDLGGADGLIHISELAWRKVRHPEEVLHTGDDIQVYVLRLDHVRKRIGLSLKRLQPDPWSSIDSTYAEGQLAPGVVTGIADFGAFVALDIGVEGLVHISELADPPPADPRTIIGQGEELVVRILDIEADRRRIRLSLRRVSDQDRAEWFRSVGSHGDDDATAIDGPATAAEHLSGNGEAFKISVGAPKTAMPGVVN
jgi:small subunit ribosomal protein S1